jgi:hypothetical protein
MAGAKPVRRLWTEDLIREVLRLRCGYERVGKDVQQFMVQLEIWFRGNWQPIVRYDNAHGFCHRDTIHADGTREKTPVFVGDLNATFTFGIQDPKANWRAHHARFLKAVSP